MPGVHGHRQLDGWRGRRKLKTKISYFEMSAEFSDGGQYRYRLDRAWDFMNSRRLVVIGLNPSTADETADDPTIRRCVGFAKREGCGGLVMVNLFAYRATEPADLRLTKDPLGDGNDVALRHACVDGSRIVVAAWGVHGGYCNRGADVRRMLVRNGVEVHHLGLTKDGHPKHPLYLPASTPLTRWK